MQSNEGTVMPFQTTCNVLTFLSWLLTFLFSSPFVLLDVLDYPVFVALGAAWVITVITLGFLNFRRLLWIAPQILVVIPLALFLRTQSSCSFEYPPCLPF